MKTQNKTSNRNGKILIVEDSATQAERLKFMLEQRGYDFITARNGREALAAITEHAPTLVISDIVMPEMDGYQLCRAIKQNPDWTNIAVMLVTSLSDPVDVVKGMAAGADNFILKPYEEDYLLARVAYMLANQCIRDHETVQTSVVITFAGRQFTINSDRLQILNLLLSTYETAVQRNQELVKVQKELRELAETLEEKVVERTASLEAEVEERRKAQEALESQSKVLQSVVESMGDALVVVDAQRRVQLFNPAARQLMGVDGPDSMLAKDGPEHTVFLPDQTTSYPPGDLPLTRALRGQQTDLMEIFIRTAANKSGLFVSVTARPIRDTEGVIRGAVGVFRDITSQKSMEAQMLRAQRMESVGTLASGIAHDLNNVLAPILMGSELLQGEIESEFGGRTLETIAKSAQRGADLVKQLLTFGRGMEGNRILLQPKHLIREMSKIIGQTFPKCIRLRTDVTAEISLILGDATQIDQVLLNLCVNARDAMLPDGGQLTIRAGTVLCDSISARLPLDAKPGAFVRISVEDEGAGIPPEIMDRVFDPFFTTKERGKGTGLGLATLVGIVKSHGGFIDVQSEVGKGTLFEIFLPASEGTETSTKKQQSLDAQGHGETILVVDDEPSILQMVTGTLERKGYCVIGAEDGSDAVAKLAQNPGRIRAVLVDMMMPVMGGPATIMALRRLDPKLPVIAASGLEEQLKAGEMERLGVCARLTKPYSVESLIKAVAGALAMETRAEPLPA